MSNRRRNIIGLLCGLVTFILSFVMFGAPNASATVTTPLHNFRNQKCLDANLSNGNHNGMRVELWSCNGGSNQRWIVTGNGVVKNVANGMCLDAKASNGDHDTVPVSLWTCNGGTNQNWVYNYFREREFITPWDHKCLQADLSGGDYNGMGIQISACNGLANQQWSFQ